LRRLLPAALMVAASLAAATRIVVTVVEQKSGAPVANLNARDFAVFDDKAPRAVEDAVFTSETLDLMLLLDTSLAGGAVQPMVENFVAQLDPKEQMAVIAFHSSADLIQDFTSSRELILRAISRVKYGNTPHVLDALFAAIDGGFQPTGFRRVILLLTTGWKGQAA
jgi:von Willebrand factor type A domain